VRPALGEHLGCGLAQQRQHQAARGDGEQRAAAGALERRAARREEHGHELRDGGGRQEVLRLAHRRPEEGERTRLLHGLRPGAAHVHVDDALRDGVHR
jgi:hypothetical protein